MSFLFRSKKPDGLPKASRNLASADGYRNDAEKDSMRIANVPPPQIGAAQNMGPPGGRGISTPTPGQRLTVSRGDSALGMHQQSTPIRNDVGAPQGPPPDMSLYPWSTRPLVFTTNKQNPFPRYGAAVNSLTSKEGEIYLMGGLIGGSMVKGDLWMMEAGSPSLNCFPVPTTAEGPGPRVGHASLLVGNAFIVFGGDTKINETDVLDDTLYLLNTTTKQWSRALPSGPRPAGRYGHTLNILGSKIFVFGGQVEGFFFNDLVSFDLNALQQPNNRWEIAVPNTPDPVTSPRLVPPARTNHSVVTWNDKLYLFGGTDGVDWFNDVWVYDQRSNSWSVLDCIGYIPIAREGHAAALVGDVMYVFGGRTKEGKDLGDLAAFRIPTKRWYTFQNMGPSPSPRSGHGMTAYGEKIFVLGGEPSSAPSDANELSMSYILDTSKIRYPNDVPAPATASGRPSGGQRPSIGERDRSGSASRDGATSREGTTTNGFGRYHRNESQDSVASLQQQAQQPPSQSQPPQTPFNNTMTALPPLSNPDQANNAPRNDRAVQNPNSQPPLSNQVPMQQQNLKSAYMSSGGRDSPAQQSRFQSQQQQQQQPQTVGRPNQSIDTTQGARSIPTSLSSQQQSPQKDSPINQANQPSGQPIKPTVSIGSAPSDARAGAAAAAARSVGRDGDGAHQMPGGFPVDSGVGSSPALAHHSDDVIRELESIKSKNAWYASELALARKAGFRSSTQEEDTKSLNSIGEDEKPLVEALLKMRSELVQVQDHLQQQSENAARQIAEVERQRDAAIAEVTYVKTRHIARGGKDSFDVARGRGTPDSERSDDVQRRLASAIASHRDLTSKVKSITEQLEAEQRARQLAEESAEIAHTRAVELDDFKQQHVSELEKLRSELHESQKAHREESAGRSEALSALRLIEVDKSELSKKYAASQAQTKDHTTVLATLREAVTSSSNKTNLLEQHLQQERQHRTSIEQKLTQLRSEHEAQMNELETTKQQLQDAQQLADSHAAEAKSHRDAVLAGIGKSVDNDTDEFAMQDQRVAILQQQLDAANAMVRRNQEAADKAADDLRKAETRIAGLLSFQEQTNREGLRHRRELQQLSSNAVNHRSEMAQLEDQLKSINVSHKALQVQHNSLKALLDERGLDTNELSSSKASGALGERLRELEAQLEASVQAHADMRVSYEQREQEANRGWEAKILALDNDYQSAVKYLKGTEKMLTKMKAELERYKTRCKDLEGQLHIARSEASHPSDASDWENERADLERRLEEAHHNTARTTAELETHMSAFKTAAAERDRARADLAAHRDRSSNELDALRSRNAQLEERASEAERKVQMFLDTVGTTVNNYRRESHQQLAAALANASAGAAPHLGHSRGLSATSISSEASIAGPSGALDAEALSRNSMALDSLASELETLRTHWETTSKSYRLSDRSDLEKTPTQSVMGEEPNLGDEPPTPGISDGLASWRRKLEQEERDGKTRA